MIACPMCGCEFEERGKRSSAANRPSKPGMRSYQQLRYWFGVPMKALSEVTGYNKMQCHTLALALCFGVVIDPYTGRDIPVVPFSRGLTKKQFSELMEWFPPWAWEMHKISVPMPNEIDIESLPGYEEAA